MESGGPIIKISYMKANFKMAHLMVLDELYIRMADIILAFSKMIEKMGQVEQLDP